MGSALGKILRFADESSASYVLDIMQRVGGRTVRELGKPADLSRPGINVGLHPVADSSLVPGRKEGRPAAQ
jgi:hypothetical protein